MSGNALCMLRFVLSLGPPAMLAVAADYRGGDDTLLPSGRDLHDTARARLVTRANIDQSKTTTTTMRLSSLLGLAGALLPAALAANPGREHWAELAAKSKNGIITLDSESYEDILSGDRDYGVLVELTALGAQYKCNPCHEFEPVYQELAKSWQRVPKDARDHYFIAELDFADGQSVYQKLQLNTAPTVFYHPPNKGERASKERKQYDLNRA